MSSAARSAAPDADDGGRWIVVDGRRWRATDPSIPNALRQELVDELMSARRALGTARRSDDANALTVARSRVDDAKRALGERGSPWWETPTPTESKERLRAAIRSLARHRSPKSICPSDAARVAGGTHWRRLMDPAREVGAILQAGGVIDVTQKGQSVALTADVRGPIRLRWCAADPDRRLAATHGLGFAHNPSTGGGRSPRRFVG